MKYQTIPSNLIKIYLQHTEKREVILTIGSLHESDELVIPLFHEGEFLYLNSIGFRLQIAGIQELSISADSFVDQSKASLWTELLEGKKNNLTFLKLKPLEIRVFSIQLLAEEEEILIKSEKI